MSASEIVPSLKPIECEEEELHTQHITWTYRKIL